MDLYQQYGKRGFNVIVLSNESKENVERFMRLENPVMNVPVTIKAQNAYGVSGIPKAFLIGADGKIIWEGHPGSLSGDQIEKALRAMPRWSKMGSSRAQRVGKELDKGNLGKALLLAKDLLAREDLNTEDAEAGKAMVKHIETYAERRMTYVETLVETGDVAKATVLLEGMKKTFARTDWGGKATVRAKELKADTRAKELAAAAKSVGKILKRLSGKVDEKTRVSAHKALKKLQGKSKGDAAGYIGRIVEIFSKGWVKART
jgi:hypothetical protein